MKQPRATFLLQLLNRISALDFLFRRLNTSETLRYLLLAQNATGANFKQTFYIRRHERSGHTTVVVRMKVSYCAFPILSQKLVTVWQTVHSLFDRCHYLIMRCLMFT